MYIQPPMEEVLPFLRRHARAFYFVMTGRGVMTVGDDHRDVAPGDLVYIPPEAVHSLRPSGGDPIHCFCFAVGLAGAGVIDYTTH